MRGFPFKKQLILGLLPLLMLSPLHGEEAETKTLRWYMYDLPPYHIMRGEFVGQGPLDLMRDTWLQVLTDYQHQTYPVNVPRMIREFQQSRPGLCITGSFAFPESKNNWVWSEPIYVEPPASVVLRKETWESLGSPEAVDLKALLLDPTLNYGHFTYRIYGDEIDRLLRQYRERPDFIEVTTRASGETLMKMLYRGRIDFILEYLPEVKWLVKSEQVPADALFETVKIKGHEQLSPVHVGCTDTPVGRQVIAQLNRVIDSEFRLRVWNNHKLWLPNSRTAEEFMSYQYQYFGVAPEARGLN